MMQIEATNPVIKKAILESLISENEAEFKCCDYDNCKYIILRNNEKQEIYFGF
jgi:hypothetical protein